MLIDMAAMGQGAWDSEEEKMPLIHFASSIHSSLHPIAGIASNLSGSEEARLAKMSQLKRGKACLAILDPQACCQLE